ETAEILLHRQECLGILDGGFDLQAIADDPRIGEQCLNLLRTVPGNQGGIKLVEGFSITGALLQDRFPTEAGLGTLQHQELEEATVVVDRHTPFGVVVLDIQVALGPGTALRFHPLTCFTLQPRPRTAWRCSSRVPARAATRATQSRIVARGPAN